MQSHAGAHNLAEPDAPAPGAPAANTDCGAAPADASPVGGPMDPPARRGALVRLAYRLCWSLDDAEDAVQEAFLLAARRSAQLADEGKRWAWIKTIVVNQCRQLVRRRLRRNRWESAVRYEAERRSPALPVDEASARAEQASWVRQAIITFPERQRTVLVLRHLEEMSYADIAALMGIAEGTVRVQVHNAREALREAVHKRHPEWCSGEP